MPNAVGIDVGTSYFTGAYWKSHMCVSFCKDINQSIRIPSFITYEISKPPLVGKEAKQYAYLNWRNTVYDVKKILGRKYTDPVTQELKERCPYIIDCFDDKPYIKIEFPNDLLYLSPENVQSLFTFKVKKMLEHYMGQTVDSAVVAVPAHFDEDQRRVLITACCRAGVKVLNLINEPTAAAFCSRFQHLRPVKSRANLLVFDMGSSLKISIITLEEYNIYKIRSTSNYELGGDDFDEKIINYMVNDIRTRYNSQFVPDPSFRRYMKVKAENAKINLSRDESVLLEDGEGHGKYVGTLTRCKFEQLCIDLVDMAWSGLNVTLNHASMKPLDIHELILTGGCCKMPMIKKMLSEHFERDVIVDELCEGMVAVGAAIQAAMLVKEIPLQMHDLLPNNILPNSIGVAFRRLMRVVLIRGTRLPCVGFMTVTPKHMNYDKIAINIYEGEGLTVCQNKVIGCLKLAGLNSGLTAPSDVDITFEVDVYCIVHVTLRDRVTRKVKTSKHFANSPYSNMHVESSNPLAEVELPVWKVGTLQEELKKSQLWIQSVRIERAHVSSENLKELKRLLPRVMDRLNKDFMISRRSRSSLSFSSVSKEIATRRRRSM